MDPGAGNEAHGAPPAERAAVIASMNATVATIRTWVKSEATIDEWDGKQRRDPGEWEDEIVHRWAHAMQTQRRGTVRRYALSSNAVWRRPRRRT